MEEGLNVFGGFAGIGALMAGIGFAYAQFKSGGSKAKDELIATYKETIKVEKEKVMSLLEEKNTLIKSHQEQLNMLNSKIGKLEGLLEASQQRMKEYTDILQGRSPEQTKFMELMIETAKNASEYMAKSSAILAKVSEFVDERNEAKEPSI